MPRQRPTSAAVFGTLSVIFGGWRLLLRFLKVLTWSLVGGTPSESPVTKAMESSPVWSAWAAVAQPLSLVAAVVMVVMGIGLLTVKPWARKLAVGYAIYAILMSLASSALTFTVLMPALSRQLAEADPRFAAIGGAFIAVFVAAAVLLVLSYYGLLLYFMTRPGVIEAFRPDQPSPT
ncbi:MAG: hypothetical protein ACYTFZ_02620 [Planctomycetota bacterium]|jgi:hypothetical protein